MSDQRGIAIDVQGATGHIAILHQGGKSRAQIIQAVETMDIPNDRAAKLTDDYINSMNDAAGQIRKTRFRYTMSWLFLCLMVWIIAPVKGVETEYVVTVPLLLAGIFMALKLTGVVGRK